MHRSLRVSAALLLAALGGAAAADDTKSIEGRWTVASVELAGAPVPGLEGAALLFEGGKKGLTLPDGRVEKGTYRLSAKMVIEGTPAKQEAYYRTLLELAQKREFAFVVSFVHQDYDALWERIKATSPELFVAWKDCGLLDEKGMARPAYRVWKEYFDLLLGK